MRLSRTNNPDGSARHVLTDTRGEIIIGIAGTLLLVCTFLIPYVLLIPFALKILGLRAPPLATGELIAGLAFFSVWTYFVILNVRGAWDGYRRLECDAESVTAVHFYTGRTRTYLMSDIESVEDDEHRWRRLYTIRFKSRRRRLRFGYSSIWPGDMPRFMKILDGLVDPSGPQKGT